MKKTAFMSVVILVLFALAGLVHAQAGPANTAVVEDREVPEFEKARELYNSGRYEEAIKILKKYVEKRPVPDAYYMIAYSLYKLGRHDESNKYFKQAFLLEPTYSPTPELEKKLNRPLEEARPRTVFPKRPTTIPKLLEKRPPVLVEKEEPEAIPMEEPAPAPIETPVPKEAAHAPQKIPAPFKGVQETPAAKPSPPTAPETPETKPAQPAVPETPPALPGSPEAPETPEATKLTEAAPTPPEAPAVPPVKPESAKVSPKPPGPPGALNEIQTENQLLAKATEQISKAADELLGEGEKLSREAQRLRERPEAEKLKELLEQTDPQVLLTGLGILILFYLFFSYCLFRIAKKLRVSRPWLAWFPILQIWTFIRAADKPLLLSLLLLFVIMFVPVLNVIAFVYVWMVITYNTGRNKWLALLILMPFLNIIFVFYLAFARILRRASADKDMLDSADLTAEPSLPDLDFDLEEGGQEPGGGGFGDSWPDEPLTGEQGKNPFE